MVDALIKVTWDIIYSLYALQMDIWMSERGE